MANIELVVTRSRRIEHLLRQHYHAEGKGLHQLITSCEERLPPRNHPPSFASLRRYGIKPFMKRVTSWMINRAFWLPVEIAKTS